MVQWIEHPALGFGSGHDLRVMRWNPTLGSHSVWSWLVIPRLPLPLLPHLIVSLTQTNKYYGGSLGGSAVWRLPLTEGVILESQDRVPHRAPGMEPASPSTCVSASLCVCVYHQSINQSINQSIFKKNKSYEKCRSGSIVC